MVIRKIIFLLMGIIVLSQTIYSQEVVTQGTPFKGELIKADGKTYIVDESGKKMEILSGKNAASLMCKIAKANSDQEKFQEAILYYQNCLDSMILVNDFDDTLILKAINEVKFIEDGTQKSIFFKSDSINPKSYAHIYLFVGDVFLSKGKFKESIYYYNKSVNYNSKNPITYNHLGVALNRLKKFPEALKAYNLSLKYP